ncbi:unnamed protein product [Lepeophtheirus salmonis]|uniref:(salmon louse) hypothetical protein n=1 Tax=Lepeophtheirus salmonis TaxID=72036 RepID=A0A7R8CBG4_LEPSM|nr:unnamed protein product [Lepeophtheirus salmonis]CAF2758894.1 unnamed protein product [Lepeophtheirus salmonis]
MQGLAARLNSFREKCPLKQQEMAVTEEELDGQVAREMFDPALRSKVSSTGLKRSDEELLARLQPIAKALEQGQMHYCSSNQYLERVIILPQKQPSKYNTCGKEMVAKLVFSIQVHE